MSSYHLGSLVFHILYFTIRSLRDETSTDILRHDAIASSGKGFGSLKVHSLEY